jgi:glucokinase
VSGAVRLLADIGGTHARFVLLPAGGDVTEERVLHTSDYDSLSDAVRAYLDGLAAPERPTEAAIDIAAPVTGDDVEMTNNNWRFSIEEVRRDFGWSRLFVVNDFVANALAVPHLDAGSKTQIGEGAPATGTPMAVLGPGTGLGVSGLVPCGDQWTAVASEGGHATLAATDSREAAVIDILRRQYAHVSYERALCGPGLVSLYECLCELAGKPAAPLTPERITHLYPGCDPQCREAVAMFCAMLGTFASNVALTYGARGGVYIMGGLVPGMIETFRQSAFRERFEFKGRYRRYMAAIPTYVVTHPMPAFVGLKTLFD